jgi:SAM-dependent methyltransferase
MLSDVSAKNHLRAIRRAALEDHSLISLTLKGRLDDALPYRKITIRPVELRGERYLQFSCLTEKQDITKNYQGDEAAAQLDEVLALPYGVIQFRSSKQNWDAQTTPQGKTVLHRVATNEKAKTAEPEIAHDRAKALPLPVGKPDAFLTQVGIMDQEGRIRPAMHAKFAQINEFLKLLDHTGELDKFMRSPVEILDCGCGSAYLSFAAYHYLNDVRQIPARLTGIDYNGKLIEKDNENAAALGYDGACFRESAILTYQPETPPDILLALHACDTATDEAIALGIRSHSQLILCAPCCHHEMRNQLDRRDSPALFDPMLRHGIMKQRFAELLTDSFRALVLRIMGYRTDVVEFVSPEHTDKNLMIRAIWRGRQDIKPLLAEYDALKAYWGVTPTLETLLGEALRG